MPVSKRHADRRANLDKATAGGVLLRPGGTGNKVRNVETGRVLPCCYTDCMIDGDDRYRVEVPHDTPRHPGEMLVYIFCGETHKGHFVKGLAPR